MDTGPDKVLFPGNAQPPVVRPNRQEHCPGPDLPAIRRAHDPVLAVDVDPCYFLRGEYLDPESLRLAAHPVGEFGAGDAVGKAGKIVQLLGDTRLATNAGALDDQGVDTFTGGVE